MIDISAYRDLSNELARLRRLMQNAGGSPTGSQFPVLNDMMRKNMRPHETLD